MYKAQLPIRVRRLPNLNNNNIFNHGSSMLELRRDDLQLFFIHCSVFVSVLYCYIWAILNLKSTPKMTQHLTPNSTPKLPGKKRRVHGFTHIYVMRRQ